MINRFYINIKLFTFIKNLIYGKNFNITKIISSYYNKNQFIFFSKGRIALYNILKNELKSYKNEVLISPYTLPVIIDIIYQAGGNPVFIDMDISTGLPKIKDLKKKISPKTSLILITHLFSKKKELKEISNLKKTKKIKIVEDLAINFGLRNKNKFTSLNSDYSFFSFNYMKNFSTVNGGMAYVKNKKDFKKLIDKTVKLDRSSNLDLFLNLSKILFLKYLFNKYFFNFFTFFIFSEIVNKI